LVPALEQAEEFAGELVMAAQPFGQNS